MLAPILPQLYPLIRPALMALDAERAHDLTLNALAATQHTALSWAFRQPQVQDPCLLAGLTLPNRVGLAAGLDKNARCIDAFAHMGFGFVEVGTVTPLAQTGNAKPRLFRLPASHALINRLGFNNGGLDAFISNVQQSLCRQAHAKRRIVLGLNIGKNAATPLENALSDYLTALQGVYPYADYVTINISSPNTQSLRQLQSDAALAQLLDALLTRRAQLAQHHSKAVPLFVKIAPDLDDAQVASIAHTLRQLGTDSAGVATGQLGVIATNTTLSRDSVQGQRHATETGGLSGRPVMAMSNRVILQLRDQLGASFPIIGVGGVVSPKDAVSKIAAGADAVQIYTGLIYRGPALALQSAKAIQTMR